MYTLGEAYLKAGLLEEAISWMRKTITLKRSHERAWLGLMAGLEALLDYGDIDSTVTQKEIASTYRNYLKIWPSNTNIRRDRALLLVRTFDYTEAVPELEKLLVLEPSNHSLRRVLAYSYRKTGRYREAAVYLRTLLREKPRDVELLIEYTGCLYRTGAKRYALGLLEKARELFQNSGNISLALGILNFKQKNVEKAFDLFREAAALSPKDPRPYEWMSEAARRNGDRDYSHYKNEARKRKANIKTSD
jgi:tetratricopeptide (TPR) repeat protein